jgi:hypothetical protein
MDERTQGAGQDEVAFGFVLTTREAVLALGVNKRTIVQNRRFSSMCSWPRWYRMALGGLRARTMAPSRPSNLASKEFARGTRSLR